MSAISKKPYAWVPSLYLAEALPYVVVMTISTILYQNFGLSNTELAFYTSWLYLPWVIKPLWSPFVDSVRTKRWWVLSMQLLISCGMAALAFTLPTPFWLQGSLAALWVMAFASSTHDIAADGLYILGLDTHQQSLYVGIRSTFYRIGMLAGQGALPVLVGFLHESRGWTFEWAWYAAFLVVAGVMIALYLWHWRALPKVESATTLPHTDNDGQEKDSIATAFSSTLRVFFSKPGIVAALLFMLLFRFPEGQLVKIASPFLLDDPANGGLGLTDTNIGFIYGTLGVIGLLAGGLLGGWCVSRHGLRRWLWPMVLSISLPDLVYVYLAWAAPELTAASSQLPIISTCVFIEQFGYGFGFTAYMLYLVYFSQGERSTSVFSICTAMQALGMMLPGMIAGWMADRLGYTGFFVWVVACCVVTFIVTAFIKVSPDYGKEASKQQ